MKIAAMVFVKTPGVSPVKTRLAKAIGDKRALEFYKKSCGQIEKTLIEIRDSTANFHPYWAVAEASELDNPFWNCFPTIAQGEGGLAERLDQVYGWAKESHDVVILLGADMPHLSQRHVRKALIQLEQGFDVVFGPSEDGGFYLMAGTSAIERRTWLSANYSQPTTLKELKAAMSASHRLGEIDVDFDVDEEADLKRLQKELKFNF